MTQIEKLRLRLKNIGKNTSEYRMTVTEAKLLLEEITKLEKNVPEEKSQLTKVSAAPIVNRTIDGGTF